jgi:hypothetical protein
MPLPTWELRQMEGQQKSRPHRTRFNLDGDCSITTIHQHNKAQPSSAGRTPPKKKKGKELIDVSSEEETIGEKEYPTSSDEVGGQAPGAADGKKSPPATLSCPRGGHSKRR